VYGRIHSYLGVEIRFLEILVLKKVSPTHASVTADGPSVLFCFGGNKKWGIVHSSTPFVKNEIIQQYGTGQYSTVCTWYWCSDRLSGSRENEVKGGDGEYEWRITVRSVLVMYILYSTVYLVLSGRNGRSGVLVRD
jgi:hypothetical protein